MTSALDRLRPFVPLGLLAALALILLLAAAVRFHNLEAQSFWNDEGISYVQSTRTFGEIATNAARDVHPPLYYWLLGGWRLLAGESEFALRLLSAFFSILSVALAYALGHRLYGHIAGMTAAAFVSLNTFSIYYAQELRMYSLLAAIAAASMWLFIGFMQRRGSAPSYRALVGLGLLNAAGLYTQYSYPLVMIAQGLLFVILLFMRFRQQDRHLLSLLGAYAAANVLTLLLYAPWLPTAWVQVTSQPNISEIIPTDAALREIQGWLTFGITYAENLGSMGVAMYFFLLFGLLDLPLRVGQHSRRLLPISWRILVPVVWVAVSVLTFLALGLYLRYLRFLLPAQIGFAVWMGRGVWVLWTLKTRDSAAGLRIVPRLAAVVGTGGLLLNMAQGLPALYHDPDFQRADYRGIVQAITETLRPGDAIILNAPNQAEVFHYYYNAPAPVISLPGSADPAQTLADTRQVIGHYARVLAVYWGTAERDPQNIVETTLNNEAFQISDEWYGDVRLVRYVTPAEFAEVEESGAQFGEFIVLERYALSARTLQPGDALQVQLQWRASQPLDVRYKIFVQLLKPDGTLAAQRDSEPGGGLLPTVDWSPGQTVVDNHALIIGALPPAHYGLIIGLYDATDPQARLDVSGSDHLSLGQIEIR